MWSSYFLISMVTIRLQQEGNGRHQHRAAWENQRWTYNKYSPPLVLFQLVVGSNTSRKPSSHLLPHICKITLKRSQEKSLWPEKQHGRISKASGKRKLARHTCKFWLLHLKLQSVYLSSPIPVWAWETCVGNVEGYLLERKTQYHPCICEDLSV